MAKYDPLFDRLNVAGRTVNMQFAELDELVGGLPPSARRYAAWWANDDRTHPHCMSWGEAGYRAEVDLAAEVVRFHRAN